MNNQFKEIKEIAFSKPRATKEYKEVNEHGVEFNYSEPQLPPNNKTLSELEYKLACALFDEVKGCTNEAEYMEFKEAINWFSTTFFYQLQRRYCDDEGSFVWGCSVNESPLFECFGELTLEPGNICIESSQLLQAYQLAENVREDLPIHEVLTRGNAHVLLALVQLSFSMSHESIINAVEVLYIDSPKKAVAFIRAIPNKQQKCVNVNIAAKEDRYKVMAEKYYEVLPASANKANAKNKVCSFMEENGLYGLDNTKQKDKKTGKKPNKKPTIKTVERAIATYPQ